jgi:hypothetical protein
MSSPCPSCPFLKTNFQEFNAVAKRLSAKAGEPEPEFIQFVKILRTVVADAIPNVGLICHQSIYDNEMNPTKEGSQCVGYLEHHQQENSNGQKTKARRKERSPSTKRKTTSASQDGSASSAVHLGMEPRLAKRGGDGLARFWM